LRLREILLQELSTTAGADTHQAAQSTLEHLIERTLTAEEFADLYAQLICYGLFDARCHLPDFTRKGAVRLIRTAMPALRGIFTLRGRFVDDLVTFFQHPTIVKCLTNRQSDPVIHGYELFLAAYAPGQRGKHSIFYTPQPVTSYIVNSIDCLLRERFGVRDGLAGRVTLFDPCLGTGAFMSEIITQLLCRCGSDVRAIRQALMRLHGCELLPVPYLLAQLHLGLHLAAREIRPTGWHFALRDALKPAERLPKAKSDTLVVLGNPPYAGHSNNNGQWISELLRDDNGYFTIDGQPLNERNAKWLNDDYVKFFRLAQWQIEEAGAGIVAFITNHGFLANPTFRAMRRRLLDTFDEIYILDLHGNYRKNHGHPGGKQDESIFDIQTGVAITILVKKPGSRRGTAALYHAELHGARAEYDDAKALIGGKLHWLATHDLHTTPWTKCEPQPPFYRFSPQPRALLDEYQQGWEITRAMPVNSLGVLSKRDRLVLDFTAEELAGKIARFADPAVEDKACAEEFGLPLRDRDCWELGRAREAMRETAAPEQIMPILYRPFDHRMICYHDVLIARRNMRVMQHLALPNCALVIGRQGEAAGAEEWDLLSVTDRLTDHNIFRRGGGTVFPLYLYQDGQTANLASDFLDAASQRLGATEINALDLFHYILAVLHAPGYRQRYADFLAIDFPRVPLTSNTELYHALSELGERLANLYLLKDIGHFDIAYPIAGNDLVTGVHHEGGRVWINSTQYFIGISPEVWQFHLGGYPVCLKWLKARQGRRLSTSDIAAFQQVVASICGIIELTQKIDAVITENGGWPLC